MDQTQQLIFCIKRKRDGVVYGCYTKNYLTQLQIFRIL
jgi:hypothetical protein